jgi:hypothetical protein
MVAVLELCTTVLFNFRMCSNNEKHDTKIVKSENPGAENKRRTAPETG